MSILCDGSAGNRQSRKETCTHVLRPLCVAPPLAKKRASMYGMRPFPYMMTDPISVQLMMYASEENVSTHTCNETLIVSFVSSAVRTVKCYEIGVWYERLERRRRALLEPCEQGQPGAEHDCHWSALGGRETKRGKGKVKKVASRRRVCGCVGGEFRGSSLS